MVSAVDSLIVCYIINLASFIMDEEKTVDEVVEEAPAEDEAPEVAEEATE